MVATQYPTQPKSVPDDGSIVLLVRDVVPDADQWLATRNALLDGQTPQQLIDDNREEFVRQLVLAYKYGIYS